MRRQDGSPRQEISSSRIGRRGSISSTSPLGLSSSAFHFSHAAEITGIPWLLSRPPSFDPIFLLPCSSPSSTSGLPSSVLPLSLPQMIALTGSLPPPASSKNAIPFNTARQAAQSAGRPVALLAEGTTSNGRGLLQFIDVFAPSSPADKRTSKVDFKVWLLCFKCVFFLVPFVPFVEF